MISLIRNILMTVAFGCAITGIGTVFLLLFGSEQYLSDLLILAPIFTGITLVCITIFIFGQSQSPTNSLLYTLISLGLKLLIEMTFAIFLFVVAKKNSIEIVLMFFILYLAFTLFLILNILKTLKKKSL